MNTCFHIAQLSYFVLHVSTLDFFFLYNLSQQIISSRSVASISGTVSYSSSCLPSNTYDLQYQLLISLCEVGHNFQGQFVLQFRSLIISFFHKTPNRLFLVPQSHYQCKLASYIVLFLSPSALAAS